MRQLRCFPQSDLIPMQRSIELGNGECLFFWICFQDYWPQDDPSHWSYNEESQATPWWHSYSLYVTSSWCIRTHQDLPRSCFIQWGHPSLAEHHWGGKPSSKHLAWRKCLVQPTTLLNRYQNASSGMDLLLMTSTEKGSLRMKVLGPWLFWDVQLPSVTWGMYSQGRGGGTGPIHLCSGLVEWSQMCQADCCSEWLTWRPKIERSAA